ncbi:MULTISPECIES: hypothetical protein [unclassified Thermosynechococcus]|uniref:hypothetical protein n=1 Tax=unclassified Thermosynechococcus TaxID=2622553 RepID=UPI00168068E5|nr:MULTISPECIES: hypothetical protein [unclassified Thermosynechococcus]WKT84514.1 hypothetical protein QYC28_04080 [Thermosynechococcus sp. HY596]WNC63647.1 hypothetical protein RHK13_04080 [Thermosynechococcus sp. HY591]WNC66209.1 hypothetical protein RHK28_04100 [Thermosynechococcus sp. HY593]
MSASPDYTKFPLALLLLVVLGYVLVGWYLSAYPWMWSAYASFLAAILTVFVVGGTSSLLRSRQSNPKSIFSGLIMRVGTPSLFTVLVLSTAVTLAIIAFHVFSVIAILIGTEILVRIEMKAAGYQNWQIMLVLIQMAILGVFIGWSIGHYLLPSSSGQSLLFLVLKE